jgi:hypothetical protein
LNHEDTEEKLGELEIGKRELCELRDGSTKNMENTKKKYTGAEPGHESYQKETECTC